MTLKMKKGREDGAYDEDKEYPECEFCGGAIDKRRKDHCTCNFQ